MKHERASWCCLLPVLNWCGVHEGDESEAAEGKARLSAAARVALLAVTIVTALTVHRVTDKEAKIKPLLSATWRVSTPTQDWMGKFVKFSVQSLESDCWMFALLSNDWLTDAGEGCSGD